MSIGYLDLSSPCPECEAPMGEHRVGGIYHPKPIIWNEVGDGTPLHAWLETKREGEKGTNVCMCRLMSIGDDPEWIEKEGGRTTVTHSTFAAPTHWRWPVNQQGPAALDPVFNRNHPKT